MENTASFDRGTFASVLQKTFTENGLGKYLSFDRVQTFVTLTERMLDENEKYNLTAIKDPAKIALLHYADCVTLAQFIPKGAKVIDVGCGAGFPSLPLAIVRPDVEILAVDSTEKRVKYVEETARLLGLTNLTTRVMRGEDGGKDPAFRETFDIATARAVAETRILLELCLPYVKVGGEMVAMKGKNASFEVAGAKKALSLLGGKLIGVDETPLMSQTFGEQAHSVVRVLKEKKTPPAYPRVYAQISKKPL